MQVLSAEDVETLDLPPQRQYLPKSLARHVIRFDFEEAQLAPIEMPRFFYRYGATDDLSEPGAGAWAEGFPPFGTIGLNDDLAYEGKWSFRFDLGGGSLAARVPSHVIPVMPGAAYEAAVWIRTSGLRHARARLVCWMHDDQGDAIASTRATGHAVRTHEAWERHAVRVGVAPEHAVGLIIELQLVQPRHLGAAGDAGAAPMLEDVNGRAWFDDLTVNLLPNITCEIGDGDGVVELPAQPSIRISIRDAARAPLTAHLVVTDLDDRHVLQQSFPIDQAVGAVTIPVPIDRAGWYRADLVMTAPGDDQVIDRLARAFVITADEPGLQRSGQSPFAVVSNVDSSIEPSAVAALMRIMRPREVVHRMDASDLCSDSDGRLVDALMRHVDLVADTVPGSSIWLSQSRDDCPATETSSVNDVLTHHGIHVRRWIREAMDESTGESLQRMAAASDILDVATIDQDPLGTTPGGRLLLRVPAAWPASQIEADLKKWLDRHDVDGMIIEAPIFSDFPDRQHVAAVLSRALIAWRAGATELIVDGPWSRHDGRVSPTALLPALSTLNNRLRGREFLADLSPDDHTHCWLIGEPTGADAALIVWSDAVPGGVAKSMSLSTGEADQFIVDDAGNKRPVMRDGAKAMIAMTDLPAIVEGVDRHLLQFIAAAKFTPDQLPPIPSMQESLLRIENPWPRPINGVVRIAASNGLEVIPRESSFDLEAGASIDLPISVLPAHHIESGRRAIPVQFELIADRRYDISADVPLTIDLEGLTFTNGWRFSRTPSGESVLEIVTTVSNQTTERRRLALIVLTPDGAMNRRPLPVLQPGETTGMHVALPADLIGLAQGGKLRVGLADLNTGAQLNQVIDVAPPRPDQPQFAEAVSDHLD